MGNNRFRLSDMIPNAWFYKLKDMGRSRKKYSSSTSPLKTRPPTSSPITTNSQKATSSQSRYSYFITNQPIQREKLSNPNSLRTQFTDPPRKSFSKKRAKRKTIYKPSPKPATPSKNTPDDGFGTTGCCSRSTFESLSEPEKDHDHGFAIPKSSDHQVLTLAKSCKSRVSSSPADIIIDMDEERHPIARKPDKVAGPSSASELDLPRIHTKSAKLGNKQTTEPAKQNRSSSKFEETKSSTSLSVKTAEEERARNRKDQTKTTITSPAPARKSLSNSTGIKLRSNSPKLAARKHQHGTRKSVSSAWNGPVSESLVVVKSSLDPKKDFRDSMVEMIVENNIRASKDLEELLACYLSLNSKEYHDLIVKAFEGIWLDMTRLRL